MKKTRKQLAAELLKRIESGPFFSGLGVKTFTPEHARLSYEAWAHTWIISELKALVPELKETEP